MLYLIKYKNDYYIYIYINYNIEINIYIYILFYMSCAELLNEYEPRHDFD